MAALKQERFVMQSPTQDSGQGFGQGSGQGFGQGSLQTSGQGSTQESGSSSGTGEQLKTDAKQLGATASNRLHSELDARKGTAATQARSVSSAIGQAAEGLDDGAPQWLRSAFQQGAQQVQRFADSLEQKDSRQILSDVQDLARNNPGAFIAGCAALGFAAARILKAGAPDASATAQSRPSQLPPVQGEEPMFRSPAATSSTSPSSAGEFV
jgi:hypothetical protein